MLHCPLNISLRTSRASCRRPSRRATAAEAPSFTGADSPIEASLSDRQQTLGERLAAVRGLARFKQYDAIETLVHVMETERDVALRQCAYESLREATGKNLPPEATAWRQLLRDPGSPALAGEPNLIERVGGVFKR